MAPGEHQVLDCRLHELRPVDRIDDERVQRHAEDLEAEEEGGEVGAGDEHRAAERGGEQQHVVLLGVHVAALQVAPREDRDRGRGDGEEADVEQGVRVEGEQRRDLPGGPGGGDEQGDHGRRQADQREREREGVRAVERGREHDDHRRRREDDEGQQRDEVAGGHGSPSTVASSTPISCWAALAASGVSGLPAVICCTDVTVCRAVAISGCG